MKLREMRFARIEDLEVMVEVQSAAEAKSAIRELRHKKKELSLLRRRMLKEQSRARRKELERARAGRQRGVLATVRRVSRLFRSRTGSRDLSDIERDIDRTDEILHNIDSCILQLEGKLLI